jgi:hypothetical protein
VLLRVYESQGDPSTEHSLHAGTDHNGRLCGLPFRIFSLHITVLKCTQCPNVCRQNLRLSFVDLRESGKLFNLCTRNLKLEFTSSDDPEDDWPSARFIFSLCVSLLSNLLSSAYECLLLPFPKSPSSLFYETELFDKDQPSHLSASFCAVSPNVFIGDLHDNISFSALR